MSRSVSDVEGPPVLSWAKAPLVVGVLAALENLPPLAGDVIEVRLDKTTRPADWLPRCQAIAAVGLPVLLTPRLKVEGGDWLEDDEERREVFALALRHLSAVDVEARSRWCGMVAEQARQANKPCLISHHDFAATPPLNELQTVVDQARALGGVPKIATTLHRPEDLKILEELLRNNRAEPICVIGMGTAWQETRITFPRAGSCLTYGYLDQPTAPGQLSAAQLLKELAKKTHE